MRKIRNEKTNKELIVGSDCIDKFTSIYKSAEIANTLRQKRKDAIAIHRQVDINTKIPNIGKKISEWFSFLNENPIVLPKDLEDGLRVLLEKARNLYDGYINSKPNYGETVVKTIHDMIPSIEQFLFQINLYNEENKNKPYICDDNLRRWINNVYGNNSGVLDIIKSNGGYLTNESIIYIYEPNFVKSQIALIEHTLNDNRLFCTDSNDGSLCFEYTRHEPYKFVLTCSFSAFMKECSALINGIFNINMENLYGILKINDTLKDDDYYLPIAFCDSLLALNKSLYRISYNYTGGDKLFVKKAPNYRRNEKAMFSHIALESLYKQLETLIFKYDDKYIYERIVAKFDICKNWKTHEQIKAFNVDDRVIAGEHYIYRKPR